MDKSAIKSFAIEARKILMKSAVTQAGFYGVSKDGCAQPTQKGAGFEVYRTIAGTDNRIYGDDIKRREKLVKAVEEKGFDQVIEETAYTWFNRLIAIRFMEVNGYLPTRTRVLSSETGSNTPDLMSQYMDVDLDMTMDELEKVQTCVRENRYDDAFALLFVKQCNALNEILPELFEKTTDYMELLLKLSYTSDGVVRMLVDTIPESNFDIEQEGQIEIIGWMYQYYNTELKDDTFALLKKNVKITKERIPSATQLFTPDWIVRYMVENSLGRLWVEGHPDEDLKANWKYYLEEAEQEKDVQEQLEKIREEYRDLNPEDIKVIDPCMGSGHILVYCFDVLMQIYESQGYTQRDAARMILENNLYGLDIDKRAAQLAYFAVIMKARQYDRRIFAREIKPHIYSIVESNGINRNHLKYLGTHLSSADKQQALLDITQLIDTFKDAKEYGSILNIKECKWGLLSDYVETIDDEGQISFDTVGIEYTRKQLVQLLEVTNVMTKKYHVVVTNPPYMGAGGMSEKLSKYVKEYYPDTKSDMSTVCMQRALDMCHTQGYVSMINIPVWMFISSYEKLRKNIILNNTICNLIYPGRGVFGSDFGTVIFTLAKAHIVDYQGTYRKLFEKQSSVDSVEEKERLYFSGKGHYMFCQKNFLKIPGYPFAFWISDMMLDSFSGKTVKDYGFAGIGMRTGDNNRFLRLWQEVDFSELGLNISDAEQQVISKTKWIPYNKGGSYRKWYGNNDYVVNWYNNGEEIKENTKKVYPQLGDNLGWKISNEKYYFQPGITWTGVTMADFSCRLYPKGFIFDSGANGLFPYSDSMRFYLAGFLNSKIANDLLRMINPTVNTGAGTINSVPVIFSKKYAEEVNSIVEECLEISKEDWDSYENSWDYEKCPLIRGEHDLKKAYDAWEEECNIRFDKLKANEERLNEIFIDVFSLDDGTSKDIPEEMVTVRKASKIEAVKSLISYAVGCMFGRYSLDIPGLCFAGGTWDATKYTSFIPDNDNCIPITDEEYFADDIIGRFCSWMEIVFGVDNLEKNLDFVANVLNNKGTTSREVLRNYFLEDFYKDHCATYSVTGSGKRPIYWLFDSGKQNGFKCLTYMHRYDRDTVGRVRSDYLRKSQEAIEAALKNAEYTIQNSTSAIDKATATKKRDKYIKQLSEIRTYFQALSHVALQRMDIDLDDGVKVNYAKFQNVEIIDENGKKQKINLLAKI